MRNHIFPKELLWLPPAALALGACLAWLQPGAWWIGWLSFSAVLFVGGWALAFLWRRAGGGRALAAMIALAFSLRLLAGAALALGLPVAGYDTPQQKAGYVFFDSWQRDNQAWELARSSDSLFRAFDKTYAADQYGGLLFLSAAAYRGLSPDAHRPLLIILLAALAAAAGVPFVVRASGRLWGPSTAGLAGWITALYPESILLGAAQMREPFLISLLAVALWGFAALVDGARRGWIGLAAGALGLLFFSPGILLFGFVLFFGWWRLGHRHGSLRWPVILGGGLVLILAVVLFAWSTGASPSLAGLAGWLRSAANWDIYLLFRSSGWMDKIYDEVPAWLRLPFVLGYGLVQPVLPAAVVEPTLPIWRIIGVLRALGWYALAPLLLFAPLAALRERDRSVRAVWLWLAICAWGWIVLSALRAGGDQWDNPRYRAIPLALLACLAAYAWSRRDRWFWRLLAMEGVFLALFFQWYISRYTLLIPRFPFYHTLAYAFAAGFVILAGGLLFDRWRAGRGRRK